MTPASDSPHRPAAAPAERAAAAPAVSPADPRSPASLAVFGIWISLVPIFMLFAALATAFVVRREIHLGWGAVELPPIIWLNTIILIASSVTLERGRRLLIGATSEKGDEDTVFRDRSRRWLVVTLVLGVLFMVGQVVAWTQLMAQGVAARGSAHGTFFLLLTGAHALHLLGGLIGLALAAFWPGEAFRRLSRTVTVRVTAIYWHFLLVLWLGLLCLLVVVR
jgi:cytochrome c oxidase subunit 3